MTGKLIFRCLFLTSLLAFQAKAQFYSLGQNPTSTQWFQIKQKDFKVIFPKDNEKQAQYIASLVDTLIKIAYKDLPVKPHDFSIILQSNNVTPNGFVSLLPKRSEFFATAPQENEGTNWLDLLAVHEYRHIAQLSAIDQGFTRVMKIILGELGWGAVLGVTTPLWYLEGDAVDFETKNTNQGRGKLGFFRQELIAQIEEQDNLNYEKLLLGSYKQYRTNHYTVGYFLSNLINDSTNHTGNALQKSGKWPFFPYPFDHQIKKQTGKNLYNWTDSLLTKNDTSPEQLNAKTITKKPKQFADYSFPQKYTEGWITLRKRLDEIPAFVAIDSLGEENVLLRPGSLGGDPFSSNSKRLVWSQKRNHRRWNYKEYQELWEYDFKTKRKKKITNKTRYQSPALSNKNELVALEAKSDGSYHIVLISNQEKILAKFDFGEFIYHPTFINDSTLAFVYRRYNNNQIKTLNIYSGKQETVLTTNYILGYPSYKDETWLFEINHELELKIGKLENGNLYIAQPSKYGSQFPRFSSNRTLSYNDYHSYGKQVQNIQIDDLNWMQIDNRVSSHIQPQLVADTGSFDIQRYHKWKHLFNFHSWAPLPIENEMINYGFGGSLFSQNVLSSSFTEVFYFNDPVSGIQETGVQYSYEGFYPKLNYDFKFRESSILEIDTFQVHQFSNLHSFGIQLDQQFNGRRSIKALRLGTGYELLHLNNFVLNRDNHFISQRFEFINSTIRFIWTDRMAVRDILPKQRIDAFIQVSHAPDSLKRNLVAYGRVLANHPGLFKNQVGQLGIFVKYTDSTNRANRNVMPSVSGGNSRLYGKAFQLKYHYHFPIAYPEWRIPYFTYLPRVRGYFGFEKLWEYDDFIGYERPVSYTENSFVVGLTFDINFFRYPYPLEISLGAALYEQNNQMAKWIFLPGINLVY